MSLARVGKSTLIAGSVTVLNAAIDADTIVFLTNNQNSGTVGSLYISARTPGTSFVISSTSGADTSLVGWELRQPDTIDPLANPPSLTPISNSPQKINLLSALQALQTNSGVNDDWLKWMQQITKAVNALISLVGASPP